MIELKVNGKVYSGWENASVVRGIEALAGRFSLTVTDRWAGQSEPWPIGESDLCSVSVDGTTVLTGFIDDRNPSRSNNDHTVTLTGRDLTGDAVDSSAALDKWAFKNVGVQALAQKLMAPHGLKVQVQSGIALDPLPSFSVDPGETVGSALQKLCQAAGLLSVSDGIGNVLLTRAGTQRLAVVLEEGKNLLDLRAVYSRKERFNRYVVLAQQRGSDDVNGKAACAVRGEATDPNVRKGRVLFLRPEGNYTPAQAKRRAEWEAATRAARGDRVTLKERGWTYARGQVWPINALVKVAAPSLGVNGEMLIVQAAYALTRTEGITTTLELLRPEAFIPESSVKVEGGNRYWKEIVRGV